DSSRDGDDWMIILLIPASFYDVSEDHISLHEYVDSQDSTFLMKPLESSFPMLASITSQVTSRLITEWTAISDYIETFCFWVITTISEFILIIDETLNKWREMNNWSEDLNLIQPRDINKLEMIKERFENQKLRAEALRDGLFHASAVVESRLSTRLAQNVKLLTYVSIFYLPLAFCASLWAIPNITDSSTRKPFIIAAALVGFITYMIVFNLNTVVSLSWATYSRLREHGIQQMRYDSTEQTWRYIGRRFKRFEPNQESTKPSDWYILLYCLLHPLALFKRSANSDSASEKTSEDDLASEKASDGDPAPELQQAQGWTRLLHLSHWKSKLINRKGKGKGKGKGKEGSV
ncbi:hypothetical protein N431DRAFT_341691, partial [Stipitochalara longipes BDJ]